MKVLITGAGGMLAGDLVPCLLERSNVVVALAHKELDICDFKQVESKVTKIKPEVIINCAAFSNVDEAETSKHMALMVNGVGVRNLVLACAKADCSLVHISTDYVFNGKKDEPYTIYDRPQPVNAYGESKLLGEYYILPYLHRSYLVRTSWLFGHHGGNFIETILRIAGEEEQITVVNDQYGAPTFTQDLAKAIADLAASECYGIYHITNQGKVNWYEFAKAIIKKSQKNIQVVPISSDEYIRPASRPKNSSLNPFPLAETIGYLLPSWEDALERYLNLRSGLTS
jgi:dTDP-4-dehydrorhamnose reductase